MNGAPHQSLGISPYYALYGRPWKTCNHVQRSPSKVPAVDDILNANEATRMQVDMARKCNMCTCSCNSTHERVGKQLLSLVHLSLVYLIPFELRHCL